MSPAGTDNGRRSGDADGGGEGGVPERSLQLAEGLRAALVEAALAAYEDAGIQGICEEGRWEAAIGAVRSLDLRQVLAALRQPDPPAG